MANIKRDVLSTPMLIPYEPVDFWLQFRKIIREELARLDADRVNLSAPEGLTNKPLYKIKEVCALFQVSKPTVYEWIRDGKLHPVKIRSRVFFRGTQVERLIE